MIFSKAFQIFSCIAAHPEVYDRVRTKDEEISVLPDPVEVEADIVLGLSDGLLTTSLGMVGEELGDGGEFLFCGEVLCDTFEQLGHEEETVTVSGQEFLDMFLEELPSK